MSVPGGLPSPAGAPRSRFRFQPQVEILEDRLAPSGVALAALPSLLSLASLYSAENYGSGGTNTIAVTIPASQASSSSAPPAAAGTAAQTLGYVLTNMAGSVVRDPALGRSPGTIIVAIPNGQAPAGNESGVQTRIVTAVVSGDAAAAGAQTETISLNTMSLNVAAARPTRGVSGTSSGAMASSSVTAQLVSATGTDSSSAGEKDTGLTASAAAQRKALALGLRYLYPEITDDEIAQAAGVSRRTLFRWEEYVTI